MFFSPEKNVGFGISGDDVLKYYPAQAVNEA